MCERVTISGATDILIEDGRISAIGGDKPANGVETIDAGGRVVMPGSL